MELTRCEQVDALEGRETTLAPKQDDRSIVRNIAARLSASPTVSGSQKLRSLARQSRALSATVTDRQRVKALQSLARLYEDQAAELEAREPQPF